MSMYDYGDGKSYTTAALMGYGLDSYTNAALNGCGYTDAALEGYGGYTDAALDGYGYTDAALDGYGYTDAAIDGYGYNDAAIDGCGYTDAALDGYGEYTSTTPTGSSKRQTKFKKGSREAKEYMAYIRSLRNKKTKGGRIVPRALNKKKKLMGGGSSSKFIHTIIEPARRDANFLYKGIKVIGGKYAFSAPPQTCNCNCSNCTCRRKRGPRDHVYPTHGVMDDPEFLERMREIARRKREQRNAATSSANASGSGVPGA